MHSVSHETPRIDIAAKIRSSNPSSVVSFFVRVSSNAFLTSFTLLLGHRSGPDVVASASDRYWAVSSSVGETRRGGVEKGENRAINPRKRGGDQTRKAKSEHGESEQNTVLRRSRRTTRFPRFQLPFNVQVLTLVVPTYSSTRYLKLTDSLIRIDALEKRCHLQGSQQVAWHRGALGISRRRATGRITAKGSRGCQYQGPVRTAGRGPVGKVAGVCEV